MDPNVVISVSELYRAGFKASAFILLIGIITPIVFLPLLHHFCAQRKLQPKREDPATMNRPLGFMIIPKRLFSEIGLGVVTMMVYAILWQELFVRKLLEGYFGLTQVLSDKDFESPVHMWIHSISHIIIFLVTWDFFYYWAHRWMHIHCWWGGWWIHEAHHRSKVPNPASGYSFNVLEPILSSNVYRVAFFVLFPMHPYAHAIVNLFQFYSTLYQHSGYYMFPNGWETNNLVNWWMGPMFHDVHHSHVQCNYGGHFTIWDRIFGTVHPKYYEMAKAIEERITAAQKLKDN